MKYIFEIYERKNSISSIKTWCILVILLNIVTVSMAQLSEGDSCSMNDGSTGVCTMHYNCDFWKSKMENREFPQESDHCGYKNSDVILCCPESIEETVTWPDYGTYEGSTCTMEIDGSIGVCTAIQNCEYRLEEVRQGKRQDTTAGHCSFDGSTEIVCCPFEKPMTNSESKVRPAEKACREYQSFANEDGGAMHINTNIIGGKPAKPGQFPFMVALAYRKDPTKPLKVSYICGGSLISKLHVLTAAHCVSNIDEYRPFEVRIGSIRLDKDDADTQKILISKIEPHPRYRRSMNYYDIAIITLYQPVIFEINKVMPICLQTVPLTNMKHGSELIFITSGWGITHHIDDTPSNELRYTRSLTLIDQKTCGNQYKSSHKLPSGVDDTILCVLDTNPDKRSDACQGDSGGPLFLSQYGVSRVVGVVSFGQSCATPIASIYSSVYYNLDWIEEQVWPSETSSLD